MDPLGSAAEKVKGFAKSSKDFICGLFGCQSPSPRDPIEILKRLQREAFSDLMKLRDRQDKVERIISFYKSSKGGLFQESSTHVRGEIDVLGAILLMGNVDKENFDVLDKAGFKPGLLSKFTFETRLREKDSLLAELMTTGGEGHYGDVSGSQLSLAKVFYKAEVSDWLSAIAIPVGARFKDIGATTWTSHQARFVMDVSALGPPLLNHHNGSAVGLTMKKSNIIASLAQSISNLEINPVSDATGRCFSTFGQIICQMPKGLKLSLVGCRRVPKLSNNSHHPHGAIAVPVGSLRHRIAPESTTEPSAPNLETNSMNLGSSGSVAMKLDSELDEYTRIGGWIEIQNSNPKHIQWAVSVSDNSEDELGWGMSVGGIIDGPRNQDQFQVEYYMKFNLGNRFSVSPGLAYLANGNTRTVALMLRSNWSL